ncbi:MAG: hypothetical protein A2287_02815 [Candidatus Melainabacteria bacterium RIFOXYA12_FULL_32_12]|nr:MAG: hypothetical protein A2287_02815 [Candidatus Melainabacteria bacterium RIFOXYA12_FULL_32_12]
MDLFEAIETRLSIRRFKPDIPALEDINTIINAARLAPSSSNAQMWHYVVIYDSEIKARMKQAIIDSYNEIKEWEEAKGFEDRIESYKEYSTFFTDASVNIAVLMEPKESVISDLMKKKGFSKEEIERRRPHPELLSIGASIENLSLAAHALGYGTCWLTAPLYAYKKLEEILNVKPPYELVSLLCLGKPDIQNIPVRYKKDISEILTVIR